MTQLARLHIMLSIDNADTSRDALLSLLIEQAESDYLALTHQSATTGAEMLICKMACVLYNLQGCDGLSSQNYNGLTESYNHYDNLMGAINAHRRVRMV